MKAPPEPAGAARALDLEALADELHTGEAAGDGSHAARTILREPDLRVVVVAMAPGAKLAEHHAGDTVTIQLLHGQVRLGLTGAPLDLAAGHWVPLARGLVHDVHALTRSTILLTLARHAG